MKVGDRVKLLDNHPYSGLKNIGEIVGFSQAGEQVLYDIRVQYKYESASFNTQDPYYYAFYYNEFEVIA
jgi:hypothetical protein